jgi:hypothetical protein
VTKITVKEYLMGREIEYPITDDMLFNASEIVDRVNLLMTKANIFRGISSGYRPPAINALTPGASKHSKHMSCEAIDLEDTDGKFDAWCMTHTDELKSCGLYLEHPEATPSWTHLQTVAPKSGKQVFKP